MKHYLKYFAFYLGGDQPSVSWAERVRAVLGAFIGFILTVLSILVSLLE